VVLPAVPACFRSTVSLRRKKNCFSRFCAICFLTLLASSTVVTAQSHHDHGEAGGDSEALVEKFGSVHMPISCNPSAQVPFDRGIALLHSFWYEEADKQFQAIAQADPQCAMAQWGLAMTAWRPLWDGMPEERRRAGIAGIEKATALNPKTDREQRYIAALKGYQHADPAQHDPLLSAASCAILIKDSRE